MSRRPREVLTARLVAALRSAIRRERRRAGEAHNERAFLEQWRDAHAPRAAVTTLQQAAYGYRGAWSSVPDALERPSVWRGKNHGPRRWSARPDRRVLTDRQVRAARRLHREGVGRKQICEELGIGRNSLARLLARKTYRDV